MTGRRSSISMSTVCELASIVGLILDEMHVQKVQEALERFVAEQKVFDGMDLTEVEPPFAFDPRWE